MLEFWNIGIMGFAGELDGAGRARVLLEQSVDGFAHLLLFVVELVTGDGERDRCRDREDHDP